MTDYIYDPALWGLVVVVLVAAAVILHSRRARAELYSENVKLNEAYGELEKSQSAAVQATVEEARSRAEEAMKGALKSAMRTLQGLASEQQLAIYQAQQKFGDREILQDLLEIDHMNAQFGRRAQSIAVLCDGWLGRQRTVASVHDVIRSAKGRIRHYTRVKIHSQTNYAIVPRAVEPVALVLAELLDNATSYSAPEAPIDISIRSVPQGICIMIDDAGVNMNDEERARAADLLSGRPVGVTELGNPPQFGFAVIGVLAARYGFKVSVDSASPYGGVRAVVLLPEELLTSMPESQDGPTPEQNSFPQAVTTSQAPATPESEVPLAPPTYVANGAHRGAPEPTRSVSSEPSGQTATGLPKRRRKGAMPSESENGTGPAAARSSQEIASIMGAFQRGTAAGRTTGEDREGNVS